MGTHVEQLGERDNQQLSANINDILSLSAPRLKITSGPYFYNHRLRKPRDPLPKKTYDSLFSRQKLPIRELEVRLGRSRGRIIAELRFYGFEPRKRNEWKSGRRSKVLPHDELVELYSQQILSAKKVANVLRTSEKVVLRNLHEQEIPVRESGRKGRVITHQPILIVQEKPENVYA